MRGEIQSLPSSSRSPFLPWVVLPHEMNPKNFPKKLISKTSCLRITVPENLDLALEGLIRKVLREQPKVDDIYAFAADYFDTLLKIREKAGTKFSASQICPFHSDEDAHEMIKLANSFAKPVKTETPKAEKTKNDAKTKRKEFSQPAGKSEKKAIEKEPAIVKEKDEPAGDKKDEKIIETKAERPKTLELEPKTEDVGEDEEFLKSDPIKALVEKELMDAGKLQPKEPKNKEEKNETNTEEIEKFEQSLVNEELCAVVDKDYLNTENEKSDEITTTNDEKPDQQDPVNDEELRKEADEKKTNENTDSGMKTTEEQATKDVVTEATEDNKNSVTEEINQNVGDDTKTKQEELKTETQNDNLEIEIKNEDIKLAKKVEKEIEKSPDEVKADSKVGEITEADHRAVEKTTEAENKREENLESPRKADQTKEIKQEAKDSPAIESIAEENINADELCTVVDILSITPSEIEAESTNKQEAATEKEAENSEQKEAPFEKETKEKEAKTEEPERTEVKIKAEEVSTETEGVQKTLVDQNVESTEADKQDEPINSEEKKAPENQEENKPEEVKPDEHENLSEQTETEDKELVEETTKEQIEIKSEENKPVLPEEEKTNEDDKIMEENKTTETEEKKDEVQIKEEKTVNKAEESENEVKSTTDVGVKNEEEPTESGEQSNTVESKITANVDPKSVEDNTENETKLSDVDVKPLESSIIENEKPETAENEIKPEEIVSKQDNPSTEILEENSKPDSEQKPPEDISKVKEEETKMEAEAQNEEPNKEMEDKAELTEKEKTTEKEKEKDEAIVEEHQIKKREIDEDSVEESAKHVNELEKLQKLETSMLESETSKTLEGDQLCTVVDAQHIIKVEDADEHSEDVPQSEGVQIKTIQTHYYDTLQVPEEVTKEYKVHAVRANAETLLNVVPSLLPSSQAIETPRTPVDLSKEMDLEDSLLTPSSNYSLNLSELSLQTINEMFLDSEKQYSSMEREEKKYVTKPGEKCGDEGGAVKQEVEEIIHKTVVPVTIGATPVAPRDDTEINAEDNIEEERTKQEPSMNSVADSSNEGRSVDSDTPIISVEVKTVIETQVLDEENENKNDWNVEIKIEATTDIPEGVIVELEEKRETNTEVDVVQQNEPTNSEAAPENTQTEEKETIQTSSGESESTISSTATEIKRIDSAKRHFSSTRTLLSTRSLDLDKRNPLLKTRSLSSFRQGVTDFEVWNAIEKELEEAATKIQSNFRGYKTRKKLQRENAVQITTEESSCSTTPVEPEPEPEPEQGPEPEDRRQWSTGEFHDTIVLPEYPR